MELKHILTFIILTTLIIGFAYLWLYKKRLEYKFSQITLLQEMLQSQEYSLISQFIDKSKKINAVRWLVIYYEDALNKRMWEMCIDLFEDPEIIIAYRQVYHNSSASQIDWDLVFDFVNDKEILHHFFQKKQS